MLDHRDDGRVEARCDRCLTPTITAELGDAR